MKSNKTKNNNKTKSTTTSMILLLIFGALGCFLLGGVSGYLLSDFFITHSATIDSGSKDNVPVSFSSTGMKIKMLSSVTNEDGSVTKTIGYSVLPANATNKDVDVKVQYYDKSSCEDVASVSVNQKEKTVAITVTKSFSKEIHVILTSMSNSSVTATIKLNYEKRLVSLNKKITSNEINFGNWKNEVNTLKDFKLENFIQPEYSEYTYDKNYTFEVSLVEIPEGDFSTDITELSDVDLALNFSRLIQNKVSKQSTIIAEDIWNLSATEDWHYLLSNIYLDQQSTPYYHTTFNAIYSGVSQTDKKAVYENVDLYVSLANDYSSFVTSVEAIESDESILVY